MRFELLDGFNALINILLPCNNLVDDLLYMVNIVGLIVNFSEGLYIILSLLDKKSISTLCVVFKLINTLIDFLFELSTNSLDELVKLDEIIVFSKLLFNIKMIWLGGPIIHSPQILFLQLFKGNKIVFTFFMWKFCQAYGTQQWRLFTTCIQAYYFYFFILVFLIHTR